MEENSSKPLLTKHLRSKAVQIPFYTGGSIYFSQKSDLIYALCNFQISLYDPINCILKETIVQENEEILSFVVDPSEKYLISYSQNQMFRVWSLPDNKCIKHFKSQHAVTLDMDIQRNLIVCGTADKHVCVYDYKKGFLTHILKGHKGLITKVCFHPNPEKLLVIAASVDNSIRVWDLVLNSCIAVLGYSAACSALAFSEDGAFMYSSHRDRHILVWNLDSKVKVTNLDIDEEIEAMYYSTKNKNQYLTLFGDKGQARILDLQKKEIIFTANEPTQPFLRCYFIRNENILIGITTEQNLIYYSFNNENDEPKLVYLKDNIGFHDEILDLAYDLPNQQLILATNSSLLKIVNLANNQTTVKEGHSDIILSMSLRENILVTGAKDNTIKLWNIAKNTISHLCTYKGHSKHVTTLNIAPKKGKFFVSGSKDLTLKIWKINESNTENMEIQEISEAMRTTIAHTKDINVVRISPNDKILASGSQDRSIKIWDISNLSETAVYKGHKGGVWDIAFSPIEKILASSSADRTIKLWNMTDGTCINTLCGHMQSVLKIQWINKGLQMASAGADGLIKLWNLVKSENVATYNEHEEGKIWAFAYSESEEKLFTGGSDSKVLIWNDITEEIEKSEFEKRKNQIAEEQKLMTLGHEGKEKDAAILAFKLGKDREFVAYLENLLGKKVEQSENLLDQADEILNDQAEFNKIFEKDVRNEMNDIKTNENIFSEIVKEAANIDLAKLLNIIKDCNTNSYNALLAQSLLNELISEIDIEKLKEVISKKPEKTDENEENFNKKKHKKRQNMGEVIDILIAYTERHAARIDKFIKFSCFIDYLAQKMDLVIE